MEPPNLERVKEFHKEQHSAWLNILWALDKTLVSARDSGKTNIYLTKARIKRPESAYLKFKRKGRDSLLGITDWLGFRVLCLFPQDIEPTYGFLSQLFLGCDTESVSEGLDFTLQEVTVFNWPDADASLLKDVLLRKTREACGADEVQIKEVSDGKKLHVAYVKRKPQDTQESSTTTSFVYEHKQRGSGYRSVHFVVTIKHGGTEISGEVQLRTLLQDVWGELEHALSYKKGAIHPHIKNSFYLLSRELEAKDILVSQLRDIRDSEAAIHRYAFVSSGPRSWFNYPEEMRSVLFPTTESGALFANFARLCTSRKGESWLELAQRHLDDIKSHLESNCENAGLRSYFLGMEQAFLDFCRGRILDAEAGYKSVAASGVGETQWFVQFRIGEILLAQDRIEEALVAFDTCELLMDQPADANHVDRYRAKIGLAYAYWSLGVEFLDIVISKIKEAETEFDLVKEAVGVGPGKYSREVFAELAMSMANNNCYYYMEHWINTPEDAEVNEQLERKVEAEKRFKILLDLVETHPPTLTSNAYDTLAWFSYQRFLNVSTGVSDRAIDVENARLWLDSAAKYMERAEQLANLAPSRLISSAMHRDHMQVILAARHTWEKRIGSTK